MPGELLIGVEEEFLLVDAATRLPAPRIGPVIDEARRSVGDRAQKELHGAQIEHATTPCRTLGELRADLVSLRQAVVGAAAAHGATVVASGTYPGAMGEAGRMITPGGRYQAMGAANALVAREQLICGCHIHVSVGDREHTVAVMNRIRRWLPVLMALAANSPFWEGQETGFASFRTEVWARWPTAGPPGAFDSVEEYDRLLDRLVASGVILDRGMAYWDVRPSDNFPTLETRIADVMPTVDEVVAVAGLTRAVVAWCSAQEGRAPALRPELLRAANWSAARGGLHGQVLDPLDGTVHPAPEAVRRLLDQVAPFLAELGDEAEVRRLVDAILADGNGADRQRSAFSAGGAVDAVVDTTTLGEDGEPPRRDRS